MRILLADDHAILRAGLRRILEEEFPDVVVGEAATTRELLDRLKEGPWTLLVLDVSMEGQNTLNLLPQVKATRPDMPVLVLSMYGERPFVVRALQAGATAYLTKERAPDELIRAIRAVLSGKRYVDQATAERLAEHLAAGEPGKPHESLSPREYEIFLLLASAKTVSEIADHLVLSVKTVSTHRARILQKMGLHTNAELMQYAIRHGLVT